MRESDCLSHEAIKAWGLNMRVVERPDSVKTLLVGAVPQDIRACTHKMVPFPLPGN